MVKSVCGSYPCFLGFLVVWFCSFLLGSATNKVFSYHTKSRDVGAIILEGES